MKFFDNLRVGKKLASIVVVLTVVLGSAGFLLAGVVHREMIASRVEELRALADTAVSVAANLKKQADAGEISPEQALDSFTRQTRSMVYDGGQGYIFAYRMDGTAIALPDPKQLGTNRLDALVDGRKVIREIRDAVQAGGSAVINYDFPRPGQPGAAPKISYAVAFPAWDMFIGTGAYVDDLDARLQPVLLKLAGGAAALIAVAGGLTLFIARRITKPLGQLEARMKTMAAGQLDEAVSGVDRKDEIGAMARAVQVFREEGVQARAMACDQAEAQASRATDDERVRSDAERTTAAGAAALVVGSIGMGLERLAAGDLTYRLESTLPEAYEPLRSDLNAAINSLQVLVRGIAGSASTLRTGTGEVAQATDDMSRRTEQQAATLEQTAAALAEITDRVKRTAQGATQAQEVVSQTRNDARQSSEIVEKAVAAMAEIEASSQQISQIIGVIDEIAFQTNLLALNAGVEAARAGDAGRGFAVVASEVRALAQRSANAAKEIKTLISASTRQVGSGVKLVGETGQALARIAAQVDEVDAAVGEIAGSAREQATGLAEVNAAVSRMDQVTQQNAAMVEQSTAAARSLAAETEELAGMAGRFRLDLEDGSISAGIGPEHRRLPAALATAPRPAKVAPARLRVVSRSAEGATHLPTASAAAPQGWQEF